MFIRTLAGTECENGWKGYCVVAKQTQSLTSRSQRNILIYLYDVHEAFVATLTVILIVMDWSTVRKE